MTVTITGIPELQQTLAGIRRMPAQVLDDMATIAYTTMRAGAGRHSPRPEGTGNLFRSLFREGAGTLVQRVGHAGPDYAEHVIFGSRAHEIRPKTPGGVLAWRSRFGGPMIFRRRVWHPGYIGNNYRDEALNAALQHLAASVSTRLGAL